MKKNKFMGHKTRRNRPFEGKINQLKRETVVLCNLAEFDAFKQALNDAHVDYDLGDFYNTSDSQNIIVVKK